MVRRCAAAVLLLTLWSDGEASAATLTLKNGDAVVGDVTSQTDAAVTVRTAESTLVINRAEIAAIDSSGSALTPASAESDSEFQRGYRMGLEKGSFDAEDAIELQARRMRQTSACIGMVLEIALIVALVLWSPR